VTRRILWWRHPTGVQRGIHLANRIYRLFMRRFNRITTILVEVAAGVARWIVLIGRNDGQPQILADWP